MNATSEKEERREWDAWDEGKEDAMACRGMGRGQLTQGKNH